MNHEKRRGFNLETAVGHPKAKRCCAWSYQDNGETQYVTVLEIPPVESPITAVRVAIAGEAKSRQRGEKT